MARGRRFAADERARFTGMLPSTVFDPTPPTDDRFPVTIGECMPISEADTSEDRYGEPANCHTEPVIK